jgi:hypothetical protein
VFLADEMGGNAMKAMLRPILAVELAVTLVYAVAALFASHRHLVTAANAFNHGG